MMRTTPSCPSSTGMRRHPPAAGVVTKHEKRRRDPFASASAIRDAAEASAYGPGGQSPGMRAVSAAIACGGTSDASGCANAVASSHATTADRGGTPTTRERDFDAGRIDGQPRERPQRRLERQRRRSDHARRRQVQLGHRARHQLALRGAGEDNRRGALHRRELSEQRQTRFAAVLPLTIRRIGDDDRGRARRRGDRAGGRDARAESLDRPRLD